MRSVKDTKRATVHIGYDGRVHKRFSGPFADLRFRNEVRILRYLAEKACPFVPKLIEADAASLYMITSNCGGIVDKIGDDKLKALFDELESFGVRHGDPFARNVTYNRHLGRFCLIDFEFATILETGEGLTTDELERLQKEQ
jgi:tRNA A-37 threonylcarbamoyl transferase component Bud32